MPFHVGLENCVAQQAFRIRFNWERHEVSFNMHPQKHIFFKEPSLCAVVFPDTRAYVSSAGVKCRDVFHVGNCYTIFCVRHVPISNVIDEKEKYAFFKIHSSFFILYLGL